MVSRGNVTYRCDNCGCEFLGWTSGPRKYCSVGCSKLTRGIRHGQSRTRLHGIWCSMKTRCLCATQNAFKYYGGRGVTVCKEWIDSFIAFRDWALSNGYSDSLGLDRVNNDGNYEPSNCRWATRSQQMRNTRKRRDGKTSRYKGVSWCANVGKWRAQMCCTRKPSHHIGVYSTEELAAIAYDDAVVAETGECFGVNFPERFNTQGGVRS